jgi:hypothetical protein
VLGSDRGGKRLTDDLVDRLLAQTGLYVGTDRRPEGHERPYPTTQIARIRVSALPGGVGVSFDYEGLSGNPERRMTHREHAVLARTADGLALHSVSIHAPVLVELRESEPGYFRAGAGAAPFPVAIRIEIPAAGELVYTWLFGEPGEAEVRVGNIGEVALVTS